MTSATPAHDVHAGAEPDRRTRVFRAAVAVVVIAAAAIVVVFGTGLSRLDGAPRGARTASTTVSTACSKLFVPAFFWPQPGWTNMLRGRHAPKVVILDVSGVGAGSAPEPAFQAAVARAQRKGVLVLGYVSTAYGARSLADVEADVRNYAAWYGVTSVFFDEVSSQPGELGYYRALSAYVRAQRHHTAIWLNTGDYPPRGYMSLGNVLMTYESPYASFAAAKVPGWAAAYSPLRFAYNVYDTPVADWHAALRLAGERGAGWTYVTDGTGANPYGALPSYWLAEKAADAGCRR